MVGVKVNGRIHDNPGEKAGILNEQFSSEFTKDDKSNLLNLGTSLTPVHQT